MSRIELNSPEFSPKITAMARYFFDIHDGPLSSHDEEGEELSDLEEAKREAVHAVTQLGRDHLPTGSTERLVIDVRDESEKIVLSVRLTLEFITP